MLGIIVAFRFYYTRDGENFATEVSGAALPRTLVATLIYTSTIESQKALVSYSI